MSDNPDSKPEKEPSLLAQTFAAIGGTVFQLAKVATEPPMELNKPMWNATANFTMDEYAACLRLKRDWANGAR